MNNPVFIFDLKQQSTYVELTVLDITGRVVKTLVNEVQNAGSFSVNWTIDNELSGMYLYKIKAGNFVELKKCVLQR